jgi:hypothetical protein
VTRHYEVAPSGGKILITETCTWGECYDQIETIEEEQADL